MGDSNKWKAIESEMDRFEAEISSLTRQPNFIPAQIKRPAVSVSSTPAIVSVPPMIRKPAPVVISGAPQKYAGPEVTLRKPVPSNISGSAPHTTSIRMGTSMIPSSLQPTHIRPVVPSAAVATMLPAAAAASTSLPPSTTVAGSSSSLPGSAAASDTSKVSTSDADKVVVKKKKKKKDDGKAKKPLRSAGGQIWEDTTLTDWDPSDFRLFCGDLGNDVTDEVLTRVFGRYPSFQKAKVIRDKRTNKTKGYGFVSFKDPNDFVRAIRELDGRYVGSRPIKLRKSNWRNRNLDQARKRDKERSQLLGIKKPLTKPR